MVANSIQHCEQTLMFTDIVGYSRLMGRNESLAVEMLGDYRSILLSHIEGQGGILVEFVGDAIFARFNSATSAVAAAIAIQQHLLAFNEARDKKLPRLQTRIGLHKGEVMLRDGGVFGDSVNIAARLEPLAVSDGICISQAVYDEIRLTLSSPAKRLGAQALKNIQQKVRVYLIKPSGIGWRDHLHYFLRGLSRKIVAYRYPITAAVLMLIAAGIYFIPRWLVPGYAANYVEIADFKNLMNEKGDADYFSAGITEAVRSQLADMRDVYIVDAKEGIRAPIRLEGSVQRLGDNLRIAYRLFRRKDNVQIVGGKLDGTYQDIFILQDRLVGEIARYLADEFKLQNFRPAPLRLTNDITAYDFYLKGLEFLEKSNSHANTDDAIKYFSTALVHDEKFALANTGMCLGYLKKYEITKISKWLDLAEKFCLKSLSFDDKSSDTYKAIGAVYRDLGRYSEAISYLEQGLAANPDDVSCAMTLADVYELIGKNKISEDIYNRTIFFNPKNWRAYFGYGYYLTKNGRYDEAIEKFEEVLDFTPDNVLAITNIASNYLMKVDFKKAADYYKMASSIEPSAITYVNTGTMYYFLKDFKMAAFYYKKAVELDSQNYQMIAYLADAYKFIPDKKNEAVKWFNSVIALTREEINKGGYTLNAYPYLARGLVFKGDIAEAKKVLNESDAINESVDSLYSHLRIAAAEKNAEYFVLYAKKMVSSGYPEELLRMDPDFLIFKNLEF